MRRKWQYKAVNLERAVEKEMRRRKSNGQSDRGMKGSAALVRVLNGLGVQGWELITVDNGGGLFKREKTVNSLKE